MEATEERVGLVVSRLRTNEGHTIRIEKNERRGRARSESIWSKRVDKEVLPATDLTRRKRIGWHTLIRPTWFNNDGGRNHSHLNWVILVVQWSLLLTWERSGAAVTARAFDLLHTWDMRSAAAAAGASHLLTRGRRSSRAWERSETPVTVSGLPLHAL
jgi:hypothetical protein